MTRFHSEAWTPPKFDHRHVPKGETRYDGQTDKLPPDDNEGYFADIAWKPNPASAAILAAEKADTTQEPESAPVVLEVAARATEQTAMLAPDVAAYMDGVRAGAVHHA
ncbi:MAG TPA: hypothetical protein VLG11_03905 [Candidatus Saccharimonadales bacterium]|nr:hypothetical protein [Candidatus Saccharimonadales bacterium]